MVTRAITPKRDDTMLAGWQLTPEKARSVMLEAQPTLTRFFFMVGMLLSAIGGLSLLSGAWRFNYLVPAGWGTIFLTLGLSLIALHAFCEKDEQFRRAYSLAGLFIVLVSALLRVLPIGGVLGGAFLSVGFPGICLGLVLIGSVLRHETNVVWRNFLSNFLMGFAALSLAVGFIFVNLYTRNFVGEGVLLMFLGLVFAIVSMTFLEEKLAQIVSLFLGGFGLLSIALGLIRWWLIGIDFLVPCGVILVGMGLLYVAVCLAVSSDWPIVVLTRREFASFFYSPIAYPVLLGLTLIAWLNFALFINSITEARSAVPEPIVQFYIISLIPVFAQMFVVPVLTMRVLSEEQRSGTLEVLLTAPVNEMPVVLSKFFAALTIYMVSWLPMYLYLVGLWVIGGERFDYRPVLSFTLAVLATGAGFIGMGIFC